MIRSPARRDVLIALVLFALMLAMPLLTGSRYVLTQLTVFLTLAVVASQRTLDLGVAGIFSLAQMALLMRGCARSSGPASISMSWTRASRAPLCRHAVYMQRGGPGRT